MSAPTPTAPPTADDPAEAAPAEASSASSSGAPSGSSSGSSSGPGAAVWRADALADPHADAAKADKVRSMFAAIARSYDLNNRVHALWMDVLWRKAAARAADVQPGDRVLDVACGTGDLTMEFARRTPAASVLGLDFTAEMLDLARVKKYRGRASGPGERIEYQQGDAQALPFGDRSFDVVSIAYGIRNVQEPARALAEFARVLRPGGRLVILEFDRPGLAPVRWFNSFYAGWLMPRTATLISRDRSGAYRYLPRSVERFVSRAELEGLISAAGFEGVRSRGLSLGICACYRAVRAG